MKSLILLEMALLAGGGLVGRKNKDGSWQAVFFSDKGTLPELIAVLILLTLLLTADEVGLGGAAGLFGGLVTLSYLMAAVGWLGPATQQAAQQLFGA